MYVVGRQGRPPPPPDPQPAHAARHRPGRDGGQPRVCGGQFEINLGHSAALDAADRSFRLKSAVQEIARLDGLLATFMAKPFNDEGGSGFHLHASLVNSGGRNVFGDPGGEHGLSGTGRHAIAGVLAHAPALAALLNPTINSYKRFGPDTLAPGWSTGAWTTAARWSGTPARARRGQPDGDPAGRRHR